MSSSRHISIHIRTIRRCDLDVLSR